MKLTLLFIFTSLMLSVTAQSTAGNWSKADKDLANKAIKEIEAELEGLGRFKAITY